MESIVQGILKRIHSKNDLNCFIEVFEEEALAAAKEVEARQQSGEAGILAGLTIGLKDLYNYKGHQTSASSKILDGYQSTYSSTVVERILNEDGIIIGRQNCDEFGMGSTNENSYFGPVLNPLNKSYVAGGSSGGSAAAVAAGLCDLSIGTDTGGSVRLPASYCGVLGLKPTYGLIPRYGIISYASSFDTVGIVGNNIEDIGKAITALHGPDDFDSTSLRDPEKNFTKLNKDPGKLRIGYFSEAMDSKGLDESIRKQFSNFTTNLKKEGHTLSKIDFSLMDFLLPTYYILTMAEASSNLSRYDGIRYGSASDSSAKISLTNYYLKNRTNGFGDEVKRRIILGTLVLSSGYSDAFFIKAQKTRRLIVQKIDEVFKSVDLLVMPTAPGPPPKVGELVDDPLKMYLGDIFTVLPSLTGIPAISLPLGEIDNNLKSGVQLIGPASSELEILSFSQYLLKSIL